MDSLSESTDKLKTAVIADQVQIDGDNHLKGVFGMRNFRSGVRCSIAVAVFVLVAGAGVAHATDILDDSEGVDEHGSEWTQPEMRLGGHGTLKFNGGEYSGDIGCDVKVSAIRDRNNEVSIDDDDGAIEANSNTATLTLSNCTVADGEGDVTELDDSIELNNGEVTILIEGYDVGGDNEMVFDEVKIEGRYDKRNEAELKLALANGTITPIVSSSSSHDDDHDSDYDSDHEGDHDSEYDSDHEGDHDSEYASDDHEGDHDSDHDSDYDSDDEGDHDSDDDSEHDSDDDTASAGTTPQAGLVGGPLGFIGMMPL